MKKPLPIRVGFPSLLAFWGLLGLSAQSTAYGSEPDVVKSLPSIQTRFAPAADGNCTTDETPDFQKHVSPLLGRMGCNGRACHGSFQGRGGFMLSLFGYDFNADNKALLENGRVNKEDVLASLILSKPVDEDNHEGGKRFEKNGWEYWVLRKWIEGGAKSARFGKTAIKLEKLEVLPSEIVFGKLGDTVALKATAIWNDGTKEDVTDLCRFFSNDSSIASIDEKGKVIGGENGDTHVVVAYDKAVVPIPVLRPRASLGKSTSTASVVPKQESRTVESKEIDRLVQAKLDKLNIRPSEGCTDSEFIRRVSLDISGTLPTANRVRKFLDDTDPQKRTKLVEELLSSPGYASLWATFFSDITGNNDEQLNNFAPVNGKQGGLSQQWYQWIYDRIERNVPYDKMVEGIVTAVSREEGESYRDYCAKMCEVSNDPSGKSFADRSSMMYYWVRRNQRTSEERAIGFAYAFLGVRIQCAQCHKHPFDQWSKTDFEQFERLFDGIVGNQGSQSPESKSEYAEIIQELGVAKSLKGNDLRKKLGELVKEGKTVPYPEVYIAKSNRAKPKDTDKDKDKKKTTTAPTARLLGAESIDLSQVDDPRKPLMDWLRRKDNPYFARALVNRVWAHYFEAGIVNPADDMNLANAPSNTPLLDYLASQFIDKGYDLKWLHRTIVDTQTYQRSWRTNETNELDKRNFSHALLKRLPAEVAYDSIQIAIRNDEEGRGLCDFSQDRALSIGGSGPKGGPGTASGYALSVFGRSTRETNCDCDRSNDPSLLQTVFVRNDSDVLKGLRDPNHGWLAQIAKSSGASSDSKQAGDESPMSKRRTEMENQIKEGKERIAKLGGKGNPEQLKKLEARVAQMEKQLASFSKNGNTNPSTPTATKLSPDQINEAVDEAYLRTLSRFPTANERKIAVKAVKESTNSMEGLSDVLWALINTKEFILNH